jgi:hypothetical protein
VIWRPDPLRRPWRNERAGLTDDRLGVILCGRFIAYLA